MYRHAIAGALAVAGISGALWLGVAGVAQAQGAQAGSSAGGAQSGAAATAGSQATTGYGASSVKGMQLKGQTGQALGTIEEVIFDQNGQVRYIALRVDQAGKAGTITAIPWQMVQAQGMNWTTTVDANKLSNAPQVNAGELKQPDMTAWSSKIDPYYGSAGGGMASAAPSFSQLDTDQDGGVTLSEAQSSGALPATGNLQQMFSQSDANADGKLDQAEFSAFQEVCCPQGGSSGGASSGGGMSQ